MTVSWDPVILPPGYSYGFTGGPAFDTRFITMDGGGEQRVQVRDEPIWRWSGTRKNFRDGADVTGLVSWFLARRGGLIGFLFLDPRDHTTNQDGQSPPTALDQLIGFGDGVNTVFRLRKQYPDPGGMTARAFPRQVVPMLGTATAPMARMFGIEVGASIAPAAAAGGVTDSGAVFLPLSQSVVFSSPPGYGIAVTWGGYFTVPARFSETTDQGLEVTLAGFEADEAPFEIQSIPFDEPVPLTPGGSPYGYQLLSGSASSELSARSGFFVEIPTTANVSCYLDDLVNYPTGGPHFLISNTGVFTVTLRDAFGASVGTISGGSKVWLFIKRDGAGNTVPVLI